MREDVDNLIGPITARGTSGPRPPMGSYREGHPGLHPLSRVFSSDRPLPRDLTEIGGHQHPPTHPVTNPRPWWSHQVQSPE